MNHDFASRVQKQTAESAEFAEKQKEFSAVSVNSAVKLWLVLEVYLTS
jgi:hypothetical protein